MKKNERERERVLNVNEEYRRLQEALGLQPDARKVKKNGRLRTLTAAISYIQSLMAELEELKMEANEPAMAPAQPGCAEECKVRCAVVCTV